MQRVNKYLHDVIKSVKIYYTASEYYSEVLLYIVCIVVIA